MLAVRCRFCRGATGDLVLDLGRQPACEYFPPADDSGIDPVFPLRLWLCAECGLAQLADDAELPDEPEGLEPAALAEQRRDAVLAAADAGLLRDGASVAEGPSPHGGSWRSELERLGLEWAEPGSRADVVVDASFGLMHAVDQAAALDGLLARLAPGGTLLFGFHSLAAILRERQWNAVRLGHYAYYSLPALRRMLASRGLWISHAWQFPLYGGTVLVAARRLPDAETAPLPEAVRRLLLAELTDGVLDPAAAKRLQHTVEVSTEAMRSFVHEAVATGARVYGYGAASRSVALIRSAGLDAHLLRGIGDASSGKQGCRVPGTAIPIVSPAELVAARPDIVLVFVSDLLAEVRSALPEIEAGGGRWVDVGSGAPPPAPVPVSGQMIEGQLR